MYLFCINLAHVSDSVPVLYKKGILILCLFCAYFVPQRMSLFCILFSVWVVIVVYHAKFEASVLHNSPEIFHENLRTGELFAYLGL